MTVKVLLKKVKSSMPISIVVDDVDVYDFETKKEVPAYLLNMTIEDYYIIGDFETDNGQGLLINAVS